MGEEKRTLSCTDCGVLNCHKRNASYPEFCLTEKLTDEDIAETQHSMRMKKIERYQ